MIPLEQATADDFIIPEFRGENPKHYEVRGDGVVVRKDRWEIAIRNIAAHLNINNDWEISEIVDAVKALEAKAVIDE